MVMTVIAMVTTVFINNTYHASKMATKNRKPIHYLCLIQALLGAITNVALIFFFFQYSSMCGMRVYVAATMNLLSTTCIETILLIKAYYCSESSYTVLSYGVVLSLARFTIGAANILFTKTAITPLFTCVSVINPTTALGVVTIEIMLNIYLSVCFLFSVYKRWKFVKTKLYAALLKDGTIFSIATSITSVAIMVLVLLHALGENSSTLLNISWAVSSKLTVEQLLRTQNLKKSGLPWVHAINIEDSHQVKSSKFGIPNNVKLLYTLDTYDPFESQLQNTQLNLDI
ncbi:hypothetical protein K7432_005339 [Basidiobolus ranarum]|uniref:Uncharacterized protein n=1 Tax=Basidiobolus ranarum TaxID=34480 RepID=A0ABR2W3B1_9FUNG